MTCSKCGASLPQDANYCFHCGKAVDAADRAPSGIVFFNMAASLSRRELVVRTNHEAFADTVHDDLDRILTKNKECIQRRREGEDFLVIYEAVPEGYDDLQMSRFVEHWKDYCAHRGWQPRKCRTPNPHDVCFSYVKPA